MSLLCKLGLHNWNQDCEECARCGKNRIGAHKWTKDCEQCARCQQRNHKWAGAWARRCTICGEPDGKRLAGDIQRANFKALQGQLLDIGTHDFVPDHLKMGDPFRKLTGAESEELQKNADLSYENKREKHLRLALQPVAEEWELSIDKLVRMVMKK